MLYTKALQGNHWWQENLQWHEKTHFPPHLDQCCLSLSLWFILFKNQNDFDLRVEKQLDSTSQQRSNNQPSLSASLAWLWLPPGVLPMGKLVSLLGNPRKKGCIALMGCQGHVIGGRQPDTLLPTQLGTRTGLQSLEQPCRPVPLNPP